MKKNYKLLIVIMAFLTIGTSVYGIHMYENEKAFKTFLNNQYQKNFYDLIGDVNGLEVSLSKAMVSGSQKQSSILFGDIWRQASSANDKINSLPIASGKISNTVKFLSQVSDFSYAMLKSNTSGKKLSNGEFINLEKLKNYCGYINLQLNEFVGQMGDKGISYNDLTYYASDALENVKGNKSVAFQNLSDDIQQYPTLLYDGPFSENVLNTRPKVLDEGQTSIKDGKKLIEKIYGKSKVEKISLYSDKSNPKIPTYSFGVKLFGRSTVDINIDISKNGGHILYMLDSRKVSNDKIDIKAATDMGLKFLKSIGYSNMTPSYSLKYDSIGVINYVGVDIDKKTLIYPDQIKLKIALDNGEVIGIEGENYLVAHHKRRLLNPKISVKEAQNKINKKLSIRNIRLTLIPMKSLKEVLCYEFYCDFSGEKYFVYINAMDGSEERILKVINTTNGELTM